MISRRLSAPFFLSLVSVALLAACRPQTGQLLPADVPTPAQTEEETKIDILARVSRHILLPENIKPTIAEILDVATLQARNAFYKNAVNGDYLIVTTTRTILYSPSKDVIIDVMPVQLERTTPVEAPQMQP